MPRSFLAYLAVSSMVLGVAACGDGPAAPISLPLTGTFSGTVTPQGFDDVGFVAGRTGATIVKVCGVIGSEINVAVGAALATSASNCERLVFAATAGTSYTVRVTAVSGGGAYNGCWSTALAECTVIAPTSGAAACDAAGYYGPAAGKTGIDLLHSLRDIVTTNYNLGYLTTPNARDSLYTFVDDPDGDDQITDVYTGRTAFVNSRSTAAAANFNTEHAWPQSRGADIDFAAGADLNILFTADATSNEKRSNIPYGIVTQNVQWTGGMGAEVSRLGADAQGRTVFEPRPSKRGDVARAIFYFYTRYHDAPTPTFSLANFNVEEATLMQWSAADPPDDFERARNAMICRAQGNRNPYVDHPEYLSATGDFPNN